MKTIKRYTLFLLICLSAKGFAQTPALNLKKYETYRANLDYFRVKGLGPGKGLVAARRKNHELLFADEGVNLGQYLSVLATEYARLSNEGKPTAVTLTDLYDALEALNRLDRVGNSHFDGLVPPNYTDQEDGFYMRSDVWDDFPTSTSGTGVVQTNFDSLNKTPKPYNFTGIEWINVTTASDTYIGGKDEYFSPDQIIHVLQGLKLIFNYVDGNKMVKHEISASNHNMITTQENFRQKARDITFRITHRLEGHAWLNLNPDLTPIQGVVTGSAFLVWAWPVARIAQSMGLPVNASNILQASWLGAGFDGNQDNDSQRLILGSISNVDLKATGIINPFQSVQDQIISISEDPNYRWEAFYPLLNANLFSKILPDDILCKAISALNLAPQINPEHNGNFSGPGLGVGWMSTNRFAKKLFSQQYGTVTGIFNGLDYMLLYNLYRLRERQNIVDFNVWPHSIASGVIMGTNNLPQVSVGDEIYSRAIILANGNVNYFARNEIALIPGFVTVPGSHFQAIITGACPENGGRYGNTGDGYEDGEMYNENTKGKQPEEEINVADNFSFTIYPNPNTGQFNIELKNNGEHALVELYDLMGKKVVTQNYVSTKFSIDITNQPKGIYLVRITVGNEVFNEKIIYQ